MTEVKAEWNAFDSNETRQMFFPPDQSVVSLQTFGSGVNHFIKFCGLNEDGFVVTKSKQITALSAKKLDAPILTKKSVFSINLPFYKCFTDFFYRKVTFGEIVISWLNQRDLKELVVGYRVLINGREVAEVDNSHTEYTFTKGQMCREYKFQMQALANNEALDSVVSKPLVILWPGIITPTIYEVMTTTGNSIKIAWNEPFTSKDVTILGYWVSIT